MWPTRLLYLSRIHIATLAVNVAFTLFAQSPFVLTLERLASESTNLEVRAAITIPQGHLIYADTLKVTTASGQSLTALLLPQSKQKSDPADPAAQVKVYTQSFESRWQFSPHQSDTRLTVTYQGCNDQICFMPETHQFWFDANAGTFIEQSAKAVVGLPITDGTWSQRTVKLVGGGYMGVEEFLAFLDQADGRVVKNNSGRGLADFLRDPVTFFHAYGMALTMLLVLLGGALLNLTPCVLPMIPINLAIIGAGAGTRRKGFLLGTAYGLGMVLVYGGLGWIILRSGLFFGALQASPWFNLTVALVFVVLALALFDLFAIDFTRFVSFKEHRNQGVLAAILAGALSALLAGACVAPVVLAVLLLAGTLYAGGATGAQFLPFVLGLGMAIPWPFAGAGLSVLPSPGIWMVRVKQIFGIFLVVLSIFYAYVAAVGFLPAMHVVRDGSITAGDRVAWSVKVEQARREGKPLFVDFWATWCKNCTVMEKTTFADKRVKARLAKYVVVKVQAEKPNHSPAKEMLQDFKIRGLPGFVMLE